MAHDQKSKAWPSLSVTRRLHLMQIAAIVLTEWGYLVARPAGQIGQMQELPHGSAGAFYANTAPWIDLG